MEQRNDFPSKYPVSYPVIGAGGDTGSWRMFRPEIDKDKCIKCLFCWIYCPDGVIDRDNLQINYDFCKGCGICAKECPRNAINMIREE